MFIEEMVFSGRHYYRQGDIQACLEVCMVLPVESFTAHYNVTSRTTSMWWTHQKVSVCFKAEFNTYREMLEQCRTLCAIKDIPKHDKWKQPITDSTGVYKRLLKILENTPCTT